MLSDSPVLTTAIISSIVTAVLTLLTAFGVRLTPEQQAAILGLVGVAAPWVVWYVSRRTTTPLSKPVDEDGHALTRSGTDAPTLTQTRAALKA